MSGLPSSARELLKSPEVRRAVTLALRGDGVPVVVPRGAQLPDGLDGATSTDRGAIVARATTARAGELATARSDAAARDLETAAPDGARWVLYLDGMSCGLVPWPAPRGANTKGDES